MTPPSKPDYPLGHVDAQLGHSWSDVLTNELYVFSHGLNGSADGFQQAAADAWANKGSTALKVGVSIGLGLGLGILAGRTGKLGLLGRGLGLAAGTSFLIDGVKPLASASAEAFNATHQSDLDKAADTMGHGVGAFAFDTLLQTPGAMAGGAIAASLNAGQMGLWRTWRNSRSALETTVADPVSGVTVGNVETPRVTPTELKSPVVATEKAPQVVTTDFTPPVVSQEGAPLTVGNGVLGQRTSATGSSTAFLTRDLEMATLANITADVRVAPPTQERIVTTSAKPKPIEPPTRNIEDTAGGGSGAGSDRGSNSAAPKIPDGGFKFVEVKATDQQAPAFDLGVGIDDAAVLGDKPNLRARNMKSGQSLALNALYMPKKELPGLGSTIAITDRNPDSLTALAIIANRSEKRGVDNTIVNLLAGDGRTGDVSASTQTAVNAIRHMSEQDGVKIGDRIRFIRAVLDHTVTPKDLATAAGAFEGAGKPAIPEGVMASRPTGVRSLNGALLLEYMQGHDGMRADFEYALGTNDRNVIGDATVIDREGPLNIIQRVLKMSGDELPAPGSRVVMTEVDVPRLTAAAIIENKLEGNPMRNSLIDFVLRDGKWPERIPEAERANVVAAYEAMEGFANDPHIAARRKIAAIKDLLTNDVPAQQLQPIVDEYQIFRPSQQPFRYVRTTQFKPKPFDFGVEITDPELIKNQPNLDHHGAGATIDTPSAAEQALKLPDDQLPKVGDRVAIQKPDADSLTAVAVMANRRDGLPVNERLVEAVGRRDRGFDTDVDGKPFSDVETPFTALRSFARNRNVLISQRIAAIRALLAGMTRESELRGLQERFKQNQWAREYHAEKTSTITDQIPGTLAYVETPRENWFEARDLGLQRAPVAVIAARDAAGANHFEVVARADHPAGQKLGDALAELTKLEPGWGGRSNIFVSPSDSRLTPAQVLAIVGSYIERSAGT